MRRLAFGGLGVMLLALVVPRAARAEPSDVSLGYTLLYLDSAKVGGRSVGPVFLRHNLHLTYGYGGYRLGLIYQYATKDGSTEPGVPEGGLMLTLGWAAMLTEWAHVDLLARVGISEGTNPAQPLYATDTDLRSKVVFSTPDGLGPPGYELFLSAYAGLITNRFGRVQVIGGAGAWWLGASVYATGLYALNGVEDPMSPGVGDARHAFGALRNASLTASLGYDLDLGPDTRVHLELRRNIPIENSGNDTTIAVELQQYLPGSGSW